MVFGNSYEIVDEGNSAYILPERDIGEDDRREILEEAADLLNEYEEVSVQLAGSFEEATWNRSKNKLTDELEEDKEEYREKVENWKGARSDAVSIPAGFLTGMMVLTAGFFNDQEALGGAGGVGSAVLAYMGADKAAEKVVESYRSKAEESARKLRNLQDELQFEF